MIVLDYLCHTYSSWQWPCSDRDSRQRQFTEDRRQPSVFTV